MKLSSNNLSDRQYYIDWLRIILILSVFLFHTGMIFVPWGWHVKNDVLYSGLRYPMAFLHTWRMPLLFMLSGAGTWYATSRITTGGYIAERTKRLLLPFIAGIFLLVPVQVYIEKIDSYSSLIDFYKHMFNGVYPEGNLSWHHLWFILYLFIMAMIISPFLRFMRSDKVQRLADRSSVLFSKPFGLNLVIVPLIISQVILRQYFEKETHALFNDWALFTFFLIFFLAGFLLLPNRNIAEAFLKFRRLYLGETIFFTAVMFVLPEFISNERAGEIIYDVSEVIVSWTTSVAAVGYAKRYLSFDAPVRKEANEAVYPFYLLHQPVIVVAGYFVVQLYIADGLKELLVVILSLSVIIPAIIWLIKPSRLMRIIFGMKHGRPSGKSVQVIAEPGCAGSKAVRA